MITDLEPPSDAHALPDLNGSGDAGLSREIAELSGPLKAKLVTDYLGLNSGGHGDRFPELSNVTVPEEKAHDYRLIRGLLSELAKEFETRPKGNQTANSSTRSGSKTSGSYKKSAEPSNPTRRASSVPSKSLSADPPPCEFADLGGEHPRIAALILSTLNTKSAAKALRNLDGRTSQRLALSLSGLEGSSTKVPTKVMKMIVQNAA